MKIRAKTYGQETTDLVLLLLCVAPLVVHLQQDFLQFLLGAPHKLGGTLPLPEQKAHFWSD